MNERWLALRRLNTLPLEAVVKRNDGVDMEMIVTEEVNKWYLNLLLTAPEALLSTADIEDMLTLRPDGRGGAEVVVPPEVMRITEIRMRQWHAPARIIHDNPFSGDAARKLRRRQSSPLTMASPSSPVAIMHSNVVTLYPYIPDDELMTFRAALTADGIYEFDSKALSTILNEDNPYDFTI